jgi:hypothetical protein
MVSDRPIPSQPAPSASGDTDFFAPLGLHCSYLLRYRSDMVAAILEYHLERASNAYQVEKKKPNQTNRLREDHELGRPLRTSAVGRSPDHTTHIYALENRLRHGWRDR